MDKMKIFVAHSFDKEIQGDETKNDVDVANWFIKLMKKKPLNFNVKTGSKPSPGRIDEKIKLEIADTNCVIGIFTKKFYSDDLEKWFPSNFILCECACALGFYYNTSKMIGGFYEEGIDPRDLALITIGGLELVPFNRNKLDEDKTKFVNYLKNMSELISSGGYVDGQTKIWEPPYIQQYLWKIYTIYQNGSVTIQNINKMLITDAESFVDESDGQISHEIWHDRSNIPPLDELVMVPISDRKNKAFLDGIFTNFNQKRINTKLKFTKKDEEKNSNTFSVNLLDGNGLPIKFKNQDIVKYQYAWGLPKAYATCEEDLPPLTSGKKIIDSEYDQAGVVSAHGDISELILELRFERGRGTIFSKSPFFQSTSRHTHSKPVWLDPEYVPSIEEDDHTIWFQTYKLHMHNFKGEIRVLWRPARLEKRTL